MKANDIGIGTTPELKDQFLVVETNSDGYTGVVDGNYNYEVVTEGSDYKIYPTFYSEAEKAFKASDDMVVYTEGDIVWYVVGTTADPYNHASIEQLVVETGMEKENRVLQAFMLYADDRFTLGNYNVFLTGDLNLAESPNVIKVTGISLDKTHIDDVKGTVVQVTAIVEPENASNKQVIWSSNKPEIFPVDQTGKITLTDQGVGTVTATTVDGEFTAKVDIRSTIPVTGITLDQETLSLTVGSEATVTAIIAPENATNKEVVFSLVGNSAQLTGVDGTVKGLTAGEVDLVATTKDGGFTATCKITVTE